MAGSGGSGRKDSIQYNKTEVWLVHQKELKLKEVEEKELSKLSILAKNGKISATNVQNLVISEFS